MRSRFRLHRFAVNNLDASPRQHAGDLTLQYCSDQGAWESFGQTFAPYDLSVALQKLEALQHEEDVGLNLVRCRICNGEAVLTRDGCAFTCPDCRGTGFEADPATGGQPDGA